jgi:hypothetical protein
MVSSAACGQISRALAGLVSRELVAAAANPQDNPEVPACLTRTDLIGHDAIVAGALERNQHLAEQLGQDDLATLLGPIDRLTDAAAKLLEAEKSCAEARRKTGTFLAVRPGM